VRKRSRNEQDLAPMSPIVQALGFTKLSSNMMDSKAVVPRSTLFTPFTIVSV
jgi:hypothetical protein